MFTKKLENYLIKKDLKHHIWRIHRTKERIVHSLLLGIPHLIVSLILIYFFPEKWLGILILGIFLSDFSFAIKPIIGISILGRRTNWTALSKELAKLNHAMLIAASIILLLNQEYVISLSGFIHLFLDLISF